MDKKRIIIIGGGSAGVGAAYRAKLLGGDSCEVTLVECGHVLGGTSVLAGVNCWEPGICGYGLNRELYRRLRLNGQAPMPLASIGRTLHLYEPGSHIGLNGVNPNLPYEASLHRGDWSDLRTARVHFEPEAMSAVMYEVLSGLGVRIMLDTILLEAEVIADRLTSVLVLALKEEQEYRLRGDVFIDCADAELWRQLGLPTRFGEDAFTLFNEPSAPERSSDIVNGVTLCFRCAPGGVGCELPDGFEGSEVGSAALIWAKDNLPVSNVNMYPNGDFNFNALPLMEGREYFALPYEQRMPMLTARVYAYWERMKAEHGHADKHITLIFPKPGIREAHRAVSLYITTENDLRRGMNLREDTIALADHVIDTHGARSRELALPRGMREPYGISYGSMVSGEYGNLLIAGRCMGFSHIAASSCRLSRTMMDIGEAAGAAAVLSADVRETVPEAVRAALGLGRLIEFVGSGAYDRVDEYLG